MPAPPEAPDDAELLGRLREADLRIAAMEAARAEVMLRDPAEPAADGGTGVAGRAAQVHAYVDLLAQRAVLAAQLLGRSGGGPALG